MKFAYYFFLAGLLFPGCNQKSQTNRLLKNQKDHSLGGELRAFYDISSLPEYLDSSMSAQVSTYDTTWKNDDGFSGRYSFLKRNADSSLVIFDVKGSGVINRIWTPTPTDDTLDFFIDDDHHPDFSIKYLDLFSGKKFPFVEPLCGNQLGGFYCYLPIPFEKSCKIVSRGKKMQFHQIQYRLYEMGARVKSFALDLDAEEKEALVKIASLWNKKEKSIQDFYSEKLSELSESFAIKPGESVPIVELNNGGRIVGIELGPIDAFEGVNKDMDIRITWDGEKNPAVFCPVADFFGYAFGKASMQSLLLGSEGNRNYCYFPMPFDVEAKIELIYRRVESAAPDPVHVAVRVWYSADKRIPDQEGKFYAHWNKNINPKRGQPHIFLDVSGKGHYVGTIPQAQGMKAGMTYFFEGDDSTAIDGDFRMHGTGSEDYFNGGWYAMMDRWDGKMSLPLHGALDYSLSFCRTGGYRLFISDKISFEKSLFHSIEHGPIGNEFPVDYTSLGLYYSNAPVGEIVEPSEELSSVFLPDTLIVYPQLMDYNLFGNIDVKTSWKYGTGGESYLFTPGSDSWLKISLANIPQGNYAMYFDVMKEPFGCDFSLWQRQTQISDWISTAAVKEERVRNLYTCDIDIRDFKNTLTVRFRTDGQKNGLLLNRITLIKKGE